MGSISTVLNMHDGLTSVVSNMCKGVNTLISAFERTNAASENIIDRAALNSARESIASAGAGIGALEQSFDRVRSASERIWNSQQEFSVFGSGGIERLMQEVNSFGDLTEKIMRSQDDIKNAALGMQILPKGAAEDIANIDGKVRELVTSMQGLKNINRNSLSTSQVSQLNSEYENMRQTLVSLINLQSNIKSGISGNDISAVNSGFNQLLSNVEQTQIRIRGMTESLREMTAVNWQSIARPEIFNTTGIERARQEFAALQNSAARVIETQSRISQRASQMRILPPNAIQEIGNVNRRIANIGNTIANLEAAKNKLNHWDISGINQYNSQIESLRGVMHEIESIQNSINSAINNNNADKLNNSYMRLNSLIDRTEREIRENTDAQKIFNSSIFQGTNNANRLKNSITGIGHKLLSYAGIIAGGFGIKKGIDVSDIYINNSSRLGLITKNLAEQKELQMDIYKSAIKSRGVYNDMVNVTAKLGLLSGDAFSSNKELVNFVELMNKSFKLSGASTAERQAGMYQLTQAMASGRLQGDEFRSIIENAPMLANAISEYTGVGRAGLKQMSSDGLITADIIKNSLFSAASQIEERYAQMPKTFGDIWNEIKSTANIMFGSIFERINEKINSEGFQGFISKIHEGLGWASIKATEFMLWIERIGITAGPNLQIAANAFMRLGGYISVAKGIVGHFIGSLASIAANPGFAEALNVIAGGFMNIAQFGSFCADVIANLSERYEHFLPAIAAVTTAVMTFKAVNSALMPVMQSIGNIITWKIALKNAHAIATNTATAAQQAFNAALSANPYMLVAQAIAVVVSALASLLAAIKAVNAAAGIASSSGSAATIEEINYAKRHHVSLATAKSSLATSKDYNEQIAEIDEQIATKEKAWGTALKNSLSYNKSVQSAGIESLKKLDSEIAQLKGNKNLLNKTKYDAVTALKNNDRNMQDAQRALDRLKIEKVEIPPVSPAGNIIGNMGKAGKDALDKIGNVGSVGEIDKINDTIDIDSENLRYLKEIAEREAINEFMTKLVVPDVKITFTGDIRETADVDVLAEAVKENIISELNSGAEMAHA